MRISTLTKLALRAATAAVILLAVAGQGFAQATLSVQFGPGLVTVHAENVSTREILKEWAKAGGVTLVNPERLPDVPVSVHLVDVTERAALTVVLRAVDSYIAVQGVEGSNRTIARIVIGPASSAAFSGAAAALPPSNTPVTVSGPDAFSQVFASTQTSPAPTPTSSRAGASVPGPASGISAAVPGQLGGVAAASSFGATPRSGRPGEIQPVPPPPGPTTLASPSGHEAPAPVNQVPAN